MMEHFIKSNKQLFAGKEERTVEEEKSNSEEESEIEITSEEEGEEGELE